MCLCVHVGPDLWAFGIDDSGVLGVAVGRGAEAGGGGVLRILSRDAHKW